MKSPEGQTQTPSCHPHTLSGSLRGNRVERLILVLAIAILSGNFSSSQQTSPAPRPPHPILLPQANDRDLKAQMDKIGDMPFPPMLIREAQVIQILAHDVQAKMTLTIGAS